MLTMFDIGTLTFDLENDNSYSYKKINNQDERMTTDAEFMHVVSTEIDRKIMKNK